MNSNMKLYVGTKLIKAKPMTRGDYNLLREWTIPANENKDDAGFLVEYLDGGESNLSGFDGYVSWSPEAVFLNAYNPSGEMTFGDALVMMEYGYKTARAGWNGAGMWVSQGSGGYVPEDDLWNPHARAFAREVGGVVEVLPYYLMKTTNNNLLMGWLASASDIAAKDWQIVN